MELQFVRLSVGPVLWGEW